MNLLIIGAPGAGKGTMSNKIIDDFGVVHVSTGDMLRAAIADKTAVGLKAKEFMDKGELVPDDIIHDIIVERLSKDDMRNGFLFDGYPRTEVQAHDLDKILEEVGMKIDSVINLDIADEVLMKRITGRRSCPECGTIYNIYYLPPKNEGKCDRCGSELSQRSDDTSESLTTRLKEYHKNTEPVIAHYEKMDLVRNIDADQDRENVYADIKSVLEGLK